ncbi:uncharacterized protein M421DRAFT_107430 [Didymella exigua CBS 183.55]|uniref:Uncharacterized protein n=1 Tax=Didymella exigua CBS 183.55 TaxID=1150837 RepID=A0A6A5S5W8_9PLEO|nr:uncharacterized protein M421DRAFT_107430 [Didymella exigua CBS 183.55]KAF1933896.1 hypothetical protein M421DRAFT_107430 [Didymella exigua CBS 183.55]
MGIKRKHFDDASPTSISSFGAVSTPDAQSPTRSPHGPNVAMDIEVESALRSNGWDFTCAQRTKSSDWGNRTRKRVRDNRPDERAIHENTVHKLFFAQRQSHASPVRSVPADAQSALTVTKPQKSTLHSFWNIAAPPVQTPIFSYQTPHAQIGWQGPRCEDCDARLEVEEGRMDIDMDMDGMGNEGAFACRECGRSVCGTCAVVGDVRTCLQCATCGY